jgi:hypothetical protein
MEEVIFLNEENFEREILYDFKQNHLKLSNNLR